MVVIMAAYFQQREERALIVNLHSTDGTAFEWDGPVIFSLEEIEEATSNFDETKKIGEGGYGSVYVGALRGQV